MVRKKMGEKLKRPKKSKKKVERKKEKKTMDFTYTVPAEQDQPTIDLFCYGGNYQEYIPDIANPGEMIQNPVSKLDFANAQMVEVLDQWLGGKNRRKKDEKLMKAAMDVATEEDAYDEYLKEKKEK
jgi:hypothetical protein